MSYGLDSLKASCEDFLSDPSLLQLAKQKLLTHYSVNIEVYPPAKKKAKLVPATVDVFTDCKIIQIFGCSLCPFKAEDHECSLVEILAAYKPRKMHHKKNKAAEEALLPSLTVQMCQLYGLIQCYTEDESEI